MQKRHLILFLVVYFSINSSQASENTAIHQLLDGLHQDAANARFDPYFKRYTHDAVFLGTDATERWTLTEFKAYARPSFEAGRGWRYHVIERHIATSGDVAWFDEQLDNSSLGRCRGTGVLLRKDGRWKIAHYSLSMLIPNAIARDVGQRSLSLVPPDGE